MSNHILRPGPRKGYHHRNIIMILGRLMAAGDKYMFSLKANMTADLYLS